MRIPKAFNSDFEGIAKCSRDFQFVGFSSIGAPVILLSTFWLIPQLRKFGLEWEVFKGASFGASFLAFAGLIAWAYEVKFELRPRLWIWPILFVFECIAANAYYVFGQFYWAFERGYFLD